MKYDEHAAQVLKSAEYFVACDFLGRGQYLREERKTLKACRAAAQKLMCNRTTPNKRPVTIYAISGVHQIVVENVNPT